MLRLDQLSRAARIIGTLALPEETRGEVRERRDSMVDLHERVKKCRADLAAAQGDVVYAEGQFEQLLLKAAAEVPVDRTKRTLTDGSPVTDDHRELKDNGQQKDYVVLSERERAKGFVRPVRLSYIHQACGTLTKMSQAIAETYARDPYFYSGTFCCGCSKHFPVGEDGEFVWAGSDQKVGT